MGKGTKKKNKKVVAPKTNIEELSISRDGGQIALRGYSYQFLYSCYLILSSSSPDISFQLEGIEDIDCIKQKDGSSDVTHNILPTNRMPVFCLMCLKTSLKHICWIKIDLLSWFTISLLLKAI